MRLRNLLTYKAIKLVLAFVVAFCQLTTFAQQKSAVTPFGKDRPYRFGFSLGTNTIKYSLTMKDDYQKVMPVDGDFYYAITGGQFTYYNDYGIDLNAVKSYQVIGLNNNFSLPGFLDGIFFELYLNRHFSLEVNCNFLMSTMTVSYETKLYDEFDQPYTNNLGEDVSVVSIDSKNWHGFSLEFPLVLQYKPVGSGFFLLGGVNPKLNFMIQNKHNEGETCLVSNTFDLSTDFGMGYQFSPIKGKPLTIETQVRMSVGLMNTVKGRKPTFFNAPLESVRLNGLHLVFVFK